MIPYYNSSNNIGVSNIKYFPDHYNCGMKVEDIIFHNLCIYYIKRCRSKSRNISTYDTNSSTR